MNFKHIDNMDYAHRKSDSTYANKLSREERAKLMLADIEKYRNFVITAVTGDFGDIIPKYYKLAVYVTAPLEIRIERIKQRDYRKFGKKVFEGGNMHKQHLEFVSFVKSRPLTPIEQFKQTLTCPIIHIDGTEDYRKNAMEIADRGTVLLSSLAPNRQGDGSVVFPCSQNATHGYKPHLCYNNQNKKERVMLWD